MQLSEFKALLFDVDNTLTSTDKQVHADIIEALQILSQQGYYLGTSTGKSAIALKEYILPKFPPTAHHIVCGGAQIVNNSGEVIWEKTIDQSLVHQLLKVLAKSQAKYFIPQPDAVYASAALLPYLRQHPFGIPSQPIEELEITHVPLVGVYEIDATLKDQLLPFADRLTIKLMQTQQGNKHAYCDITALGVNKGIALEQWCQLMNLKPSQVIGFGDSENDLEFLTMVGYAVAMGNASDSIKDLANRVIGHTNNNGLGVYLTDILKGAPL